MGLVKDAMCGKLSKNLDAMLGQLQMADKAFGKANKALNNLLDAAAGAIATPFDKMNEAADALLQSTDSMIPDFSSPAILDELNNMLTNCTPLEGLDPANVIKQLEQEFIGLAGQFMKDLIPDVPEFEIGIEMASLGDLMSPLTDLIPNMDKLINCLSAICGEDLDQKINQMQSLMDGMKLDDNGQLDTASIMANSPVPDLATNVLSAVDSAKAQTEAIKGALSTDNLKDTLVGALDI